ncbi:hypothetical protein [Sandaracinus amylolyticus]|uniref:Uncharacterized protein n=1 Tax=Sandaracinus amylolyticus TaxID=927083 RepID=A0A0F6VYZ6_9BACT|nr:hypothetical protein [Sandaracinus amylolyticus]AKF03231.1 hypothetical protein DB32_000380 [Sandaracinus amylolyticus]
MASFRDPPNADDAAHERRVAIARALVGPPALPQPLPRFGLTLVAVEPSDDGFDLVLGAPSPFARAHLAPRSREPFAVDVTKRYALFGARAVAPIP